MILQHTKPISTGEPLRFPSIGRLIRAEADGLVYLEDLVTQNRTPFKLAQLLFEVPFWNDKDGHQRFPKVWDEADGTVIGDKFKLTYIGGDPRRPLIGPAIRPRIAGEFFGGESYPDAEFGTIERIRRDTGTMVYEQVHDYATGNHTISVTAGDGGEGNVTFTLSGADGHGNITLDISGNVGVTIGGDTAVSIVGNTDLTVDGNVSAIVKKDLTASVTGNLTADVEKDVTIKSSTGKVTVQSTGNMSLKSSAKVDVNAPNIYLSGGLIKAGPLTLQG